MKKRISHLVIHIAAAAALLLFASPCRADVLFVHEFKTTEYLMGKQDADLRIGYTDQAMFIDKKIRYTGTLMKTLFGKVHEGRESAHFLLDKDQIREMDYHKGKIYVFPFERLTDINWLRQKQQLREDEAKIIRERYRVSDPIFSIKILPEKQRIAGYMCRLVVADLRLETIDLKRNCSSVTLVKQKLWVSESVPGYAQYRTFHEKLAKRLGFDAARLGGLGVLLRYWDGSLDPIRKSIKDIKGYPVKSIINVEGQYTTNVGTAAAKTSSAQLKEESVELKQTITSPLDQAPFMEPSDFGVIIVQ